MNLIKKVVVSALCAGSFVGAQSAFAESVVEQYASSVIAFSSQWSTPSWSAERTLGRPDTFEYGDIASAWAPGPKNGTLEFVTLGFATPVYSMGAVIRETYGNGFVYQVDALDTVGVLHTVWTGSDTSLPGTPVDFSVSWSKTAFATRGLKIYVDTNHNLSAWEEIDAVKLTGVAAVPEPESYAMMLAGLGLLGMVARRRSRRMD